MFHFTADPRDGHSAVSGCNTCCCSPLGVRLGETNLITINYAPWSLPIAPPGLIQGGFQYTVETDRSGCSTADIEGFGPPQNTSYNFTLVMNTPDTLDLSANATPAGNTFTYALVPLEGPFHGTATINPVTGVVSYSPTNGFEGYDRLIYEMTDAQGRSMRQAVAITVGTPQVTRNPNWAATEPFIDQSKVKVDQGLQTVSFPLYIPPFLDVCASRKLTVRQAARDCENSIYTHDTCFDIVIKDC